MRFLVDECTGPTVAEWLRNQKHEVFSVFEEARGMDDDDIILKALEENWILITNDKDFGEKVYRDGRLHRGIILLRLEDERSQSKIQVLSRQKKVPDKQILKIAENPSFGIEKKGDLRGVYVHKFKIRSIQYLLSYRLIRDDLELIMIGQHENYYRDFLKKSL